MPNTIIYKSPQQSSGFDGYEDNEVIAFGLVTIILVTMIIYFSLRK